MNQMGVSLGWAQLLFSSIINHSVNKPGDQETAQLGVAIQSGQKKQLQRARATAWRERGRAAVGSAGRGLRSRLLGTHSLGGSRGQGWGGSGS